MFHDNINLKVSSTNILEFFRNLDSMNFSEDVKELIFHIYSLFKYYQLLEIDNTWINSIFSKITELIDFIINNKKIDNQIIIDQLKDYIDEINKTLILYKEKDYNSVYTFNYFMWFFKDFLIFYTKFNIDIVMIDNPIFYIDKSDIFTQKYEKILFVILNNIVSDSLDINIDNFSVYLNKCLEWNLNNIYWQTINIDNDKMFFLYDILLNTKILYLEQNNIYKYYAYNMWKIIEYNFSHSKYKVIIEDYLINFDCMFNFFENYVHKLPIDKEKLFTIFKKIHYEK